MVATAMWLTEKPVLPDSLLNWIEEHGDSNVSTGQLSELCTDFKGEDIKFSEIDLNDANNDDSVADKIRK